MTYKMFGTKSQQAKAAASVPTKPSAKPAKEAAPARRSPENEMAHQRILRLTTAPDTSLHYWQKPITHHDTHFYHVLNVLASGADQVQDRRDVSHDTIDRMHGGLHAAMLHLDAHSNAAQRNRHDVAAGHLNEAAGHLARVATQVGKHLGATITHTDGSQYPTSFLKEHVMQLAKHYQTKVANNQSIKAGLPKDEYKLRPNSADQMKAAGEKGGDKRNKVDTSAPASVIGRVSHLSELQYPQPHTVTRAEAEKRRTNTLTRSAMTPAEAKLASLPPKKAKMTGQQHYDKAISDLETKGKVHRDQLEALRGKTFTKGAKAGQNILDYAYESTGVSNPATAGAKAPRTAPTPVPRDREF